MSITRYFIGGPLLIASAPGAAAVVIVPVGSPCALNGLGSHQCEWVDESGVVVGTAKVGVGSWGDGNPDFSVGFGVGLLTGIAVQSGIVSVTAPFNIQKYLGFGFNRDHRGTLFIRYADENRVGLGQIRYSSYFEDTSYGQMILGGSARARGWKGFWGNNPYIGGPSSGTWYAKVSWDITRNSVSGISAGSRLTVPEPGTWGLMIAGFGLIGAMLRRQASRNTRRA